MLTYYHSDVDTYYTHHFENPLVNSVNGISGGMSVGMRRSASRNNLRRSYSRNNMQSTDGDGSVHSANAIQSESEPVNMIESVSTNNDVPAPSTGQAMVNDVLS